MICCECGHRCQEWHMSNLKLAMLASAANVARVLALKEMA